MAGQEGKIPKKEAGNTKKIVLFSLSIALAFIVLLGVGFGFSIYKGGKKEKGVTRIMSRMYPAAIVNYTNWVTVNEYWDELESIENYYNKFDPNYLSDQTNKKQLEADVLDSLIKNVVIEKEAKKAGVSVSDSELNDEYNKRIEENGGENQVKKTISESYGWTLEDYKTHLKTQLLRDKLREKITGDDALNKDKKDKIEKALGEVNAGEDFAEVAKKYSEDESAQNGGDRGEIVKGLEVKEFEDAVFALSAGQVSGVIKYRQGQSYVYQIVKVDEKNGDKVKVKTITVYSQDFEKWLDQKVNEMKVWRFLAPKQSGAA